MCVWRRGEGTSDENEEAEASPEGLIGGVVVEANHVVVWKEDVLHNVLAVTSCVDV